MKRLLSFFSILLSLTLTLGAFAPSVGVSAADAVSAIEIMSFDTEIIDFAAYAASKGLVDASGAVASTLPASVSLAGPVAIAAGFIMGNSYAYDNAGSTIHKYVSYDDACRIMIRKAILGDEAAQDLIYSVMEQYDPDIRQRVVYDENYAFMLGYSFVSGVDGFFTSTSQTPLEIHGLNIFDIDYTYSNVHYTAVDSFTPISVYYARTLLSCEAALGSGGTLILQPVTIPHNASNLNYTSGWGGTYANMHTFNTTNCYYYFLPDNVKFIRLINPGTNQLYCGFFDLSDDTWIDSNPYTSSSLLNHRLSNSSLQNFSNNRFWRITASVNDNTGDFSFSYTSPSGSNSYPFNSGASGFNLYPDASRVSNAISLYNPYTSGALTIYPLICDTEIPVYTVDTTLHKLVPFDYTLPDVLEPLPHDTVALPDPDFDPVYFTDPSDFHYPGKDGVITPDPLNIPTAVDPSFEPVPDGPSVPYDPNPPVDPDPPSVDDIQFPIFPAVPDEILDFDFDVHWYDWIAEMLEFLPDGITSAYWILIGLAILISILFVVI